jgi:hypothetical protein
MGERRGVSPPWLVFHARLMLRLVLHGGLTPRRSPSRPWLSQGDCLFRVAAA